MNQHSTDKVGEDDFQNWVLTKDRLDRGIHILSSLNMNNIPSLKLSDIFLACVSIDCSLEILQHKKSCKRSMKKSLRKWLIENNYSFDGLLVKERDVLRLTKNFPEECFKQHTEEKCNVKNQLVLCYCYTKSNPTSDEKVLNEVYLEEYEKKWKESKSRLGEKCRQNFALELAAQTRAESKMIGVEDEEDYSSPTSIVLGDGLFYHAAAKKDPHSTRNAVVDSSKVTHDNVRIEGKEYDYKKYNQQDSKKLIASFLSISTSAAAGRSSLVEEPKVTPPPPVINDSPALKFLTPSYYGVSVKRFQQFLSFGIEYLIQLEKEQFNVVAATSEREKVQRQEKAKVAHLQWLRRKSEIDAEKRKQLAEEKEKEQRRQEALKNYLSADNMFKKDTGSHKEVRRIVSSKN